MDQAERHENAGLENDGLIMAAAGMAIIFYLCILLLFYFVGTDERPAMGSHPNLASRSEVVSIYKFGTQKNQILDHSFRNDFRTRHRICPERNVESQKC